MKDAECAAFLKTHLPRLRMRWEGFRKVRGQVCKRIGRRIGQLGIGDFEAYSEYLDTHPPEWDVLYSLCRITISRFYRDRRVFDILRTDALPSIAARARERGEWVVRAWSAGCGSGEEAYTLAIIWNLCVMPSEFGARSGSGTSPADGTPSLRVTATDADGRLLERARTGLFRKSSVRDLPGELLDRAFDERAGLYAIRDVFKRDIDFSKQDIRDRMPEGPFHLVLCRNLVFTYFDQSLQEELLRMIFDRLEPGGFLVIGAHETLPACAPRRLVPYAPPCISRKRPDTGV